MIDEAYKQALKVLKENVSGMGFKASALSGGYHQVWGRDSMITLLGAMLSGDDDLVGASRNSLDTLQKYQTELGLIPNNVDVDNNEPNYRAYMDGNMWYVIGVWYYYQKSKETDFLNKHKDSVNKTLSWLRHQDVDNSSLISTQEAADWMDLFPVRGKVLYDNVLYCAALLAGAKINDALDDDATAPKYRILAKSVIMTINNVLWIEGYDYDLPKNIKSIEKAQKNRENRHDEYVVASQSGAYIVNRPYFLPWRSFRQFGNWFDTLGNSLAILFDIADKEQASKILDYAQSTGIADPYPAKAIYPPVYPGDKDWRDYFTVQNLNLPDHYHNGGIWPFVGGFYVSALVKAGRLEDAKEQLEALAKVNYLGKQFEWEFNEWLHAKTGRPMGVEKQAWSAAMYIFAYNTVKHAKVNLL